MKKSEQNESQSIETQQLSLIVMFAYIQHSDFFHLPWKAFMINEIELCTQIPCEIISFYSDFFFFYPLQKLQL